MTNFLQERDIYDANVSCNIIYSKQTAFEEYLDGKKDKLQCFCVDQFFKKPTETLSMVFTEYSAEKGNETICRTYAIEYLLYNGGIYGSPALLVLLSIITHLILYSLATIESHATETELTESRFAKSTFMKFLTISLIILIVEFKL